MKPEPVFGFEKSLEGLCNLSILIKRPFDAGNDSNLLHEMANAQHMKISGVINMEKGKPFKLYPENQAKEQPSRETKHYLEALASIEDNKAQIGLLNELIGRYVVLERRVDGLLKNTLPEIVVNEIKHTGKYSPRSFDCTIMFTDFSGFTAMAEKLSKERLIEVLDGVFQGFDKVINRFGGTKIKTIGDSYMAVFGAPEVLDDHPEKTVRTGLALFQFLRKFNMDNNVEFKMRIGIHSGSVMAGVVGRDLMQFDVFGDDVNIASRLESSSENGKINVSKSTYLLTKDAINSYPL